MFQGAGAFEVAARQYLVNEVKKTVQGVTSSLFIFLLNLNVESSFLSTKLF